MADWQGLLKFTLKNSDGTKKSDFSQMTKENKEFLEGAMNQFCNSELSRIKVILALLDEPETQNNEQERLQLLQQLQELLDSLDKGNTLYKLGGHLPIMKIIFYSKFDSNKILALQIFSSVNQNDAIVQTDSINSGALELVLLIKKQKNMKVKQSMMSAISALTRGENLEAKRIFIRIQGLELLSFLTMNEPSPRLLHKVNNLWRDLLFYDPYLHLTHKDLSSFSNTTNLKVNPGDKKHDISFDPNEEAKEKNELPQNQKYKGCISKFMAQNSQIDEIYQKWHKKQLQNS